MVTKTAGAGWNGLLLDSSGVSPSTGGITLQWEVDTSWGGYTVGFRQTTTQSITDWDYWLYCGGTSCQFYYDGYNYGNTDEYPTPSTPSSGNYNYDMSGFVDGDIVALHMDSAGEVYATLNGVVKGTFGGSNAPSNAGTGTYYPYTLAYGSGSYESPFTSVIDPTPTSSVTGVIDTGIQNPNLSYTDSNLPDNTDDFSVGSWVKLDKQTAILTASDPDEDGYLRDATTDGDCADYTSGGDGDTNLRARSLATTYDCEVGYIEWNTSSIPDNAIITNVELLLDVEQTNLSGTGVSCEINPLTLQPTAGYSNALLVDLQDGTPYIDGDSQCLSVTDGINFDLGTNADTDLQNLLSNDWFGVGLWLDISNVGGNYFLAYKAEQVATNPPTLTVTYEAPPDNTKLLGLNDVTFNVGTDSASVTTLVTGTSTNEVVWDESTATNASFSGNTITGTGGTWGTAAKSIATYSTSDGMYVEMERPSGSYSVMFGFGNGAHTGGTYHFSTLDYGINMGGDVYESNSNVCNSCANLGAGTYKVNIATDGTITYWYKSPTGSYTTPFYTSSTTASGDYSVRVHIHTTYSALVEVTAQGLIPSTIISATGLADNTSTAKNYVFTRSGNDWTIYQNGVSQATATDTTSLGANAGSSGFTDDFTGYSSNTGDGNYPSSNTAKYYIDTTNDSWNTENISRQNSVEGQSRSLGITLDDNWTFKFSHTTDGASFSGSGSVAKALVLSYT
jgi:hypothetical protein